jgi:hypothetical protein
MDRAAAQRALTDAEVIPYREGPLAAVKEFERECLSRDIPVVLAKAPPKECCAAGGCGCGGKVQLLAREEDIPRIEEFFRAAWIEMVKQTGGQLVELKTSAPAEGEAEGEPPCPACGHVGALVEGACGDCGLQLD